MFKTCLSKQSCLYSQEIPERFIDNLCDVSFLCFPTNLPETLIALLFSAADAETG